MRIEVTIERPDGTGEILERTIVLRKNGVATFNLGPGKVYDICGGFIIA